MGIRFFCPKGHRVHVKAALAGKKGFCPDCGERVRIPHESDPQALKKPATPGAANGTATHTKSSPAHGDVAVSLGGEAPSSSKVNLAEKPAELKKSEANGASGLGDLLPPSKGRTAKPVVDAIDESIESAWYVRPVGGGQYGPAKGAIMRKWLGEGRVGADSLVWREGWTDWKTASDVFPGLPGEKPTEATFEIKKPEPEPAPMLPALDAPGLPLGSTSLGGTSLGSVSLGPSRPGKDKSTVIAIVVGLGVVCFLLFVALVYVLVK